MSRETNSQGIEYWWTAVSANEYLFNAEVNDRPRWGTKPDNKYHLDYNDLGMFEAQGGPCIRLGDTVEGRTVTHIRSTEDGCVVTVE